MSRLWTILLFPVFCFAVDLGDILWAIGRHYRSLFRLWVDIRHE